MQKEGYQKEIYHTLSLDISGKITIKTGNFIMISKTFPSWVRSDFIWVTGWITSVAYNLFIQFSLFIPVFIFHHRLLFGFNWCIFQIPSQNICFKFTIRRQTIVSDRKANCSYSSVALLYWDLNCIYACIFCVVHIIYQICSTILKSLSHSGHLLISYKHTADKYIHALEPRLAKFNALGIILCQPSAAHMHFNGIFQLYFTRNCNSIVIWVGYW